MCILTRNKYSIFISYRDQPKSRNLAIDVLEKELSRKKGYNVYTDKNIRNPLRQVDELYPIIEERKNFIIILTSELLKEFKTNQNKYVDGEVYFITEIKKAILSGSNIIPVLYVEKNDKEDEMKEDFMAILQPSELAWLREYSYISHYPASSSSTIDRIIKRLIPEPKNTTCLLYIIIGVLLAGIFLLSYNKYIGQNLQTKFGDGDIPPKEVVTDSTNTKPPKQREKPIEIPDDLSENFSKASLKDINKYISAYNKKDKHYLTLHHAELITIIEKDNSSISMKIIKAYNKELEVRDNKFDCLIEVLKKNGIK